MLNNANNYDDLKPTDVINQDGSQSNDAIADNVKADAHAANQSDAEAQKSGGYDNADPMGQSLANQSADSATVQKSGDKKNGEAFRTMIVAAVLCLVCSVAVSVAAVSMKPRQLENIAIDRNKNILMAANLFDPAKDSDADAIERFKNVQTRLIDLKKGVFASDADLKAAGIDDVAAYDAHKAAKDETLGYALMGDNDLARIGRLPKFAKIYLINDDSGALKNVVLPINGYGLWGQIYGFITLKADLNTIEGISFYQHKETPGLGALITEPRWRAQWNNKTAFDDSGKLVTGVVKSGTPKPNPNYVDGVTGATITSMGVNNMIQFWFSEQAYKPFLDNLRQNPQLANKSEQTTQQAKQLAGGDDGSGL